MQRAVLANLSRVQAGGLQSLETSVRRALRSAAHCLRASLDSAYGPDITRALAVYTLVARGVFSYGQEALSALNQGRGGGGGGRTGGSQRSQPR